MKSILFATLALHAEAIKIPLDAETTFAQVKHLNPHSNQYHCDTLPRQHGIWTYEFNQAACACFFVFEIDFDPQCEDQGLVWNPLHIAGDMSTLCITGEEYDSIFDHGLGPDCWPGTSDDPDLNEDQDDEENDGEGNDGEGNDGEGEINDEVDDNDGNDGDDGEGDVDLDDQDDGVDDDCDGLDEFNCIQLHAHNNYRCRHGVPPLVYDEDLAEWA